MERYPHSHYYGDECDPDGDLYSMEWNPDNYFHGAEWNQGTVNSVWNGIRNTISSVVNGIKNTVSGAFNAMWSGSGALFPEFIIRSGTVWGNAVNYITGLASAGWRWGADIINGIVNGIGAVLVQLPVR